MASVQALEEMSWAELWTSDLDHFLVELDKQVVILRSFHSNRRAGV